MTANPTKQRPVVHWTAGPLRRDRVRPLCGTFVPAASATVDRDEVTCRHCRKVDSLRLLCSAVEADPGAAVVEAMDPDEREIETKLRAAKNELAARLKSEQK